MEFILAATESLKIFQTMLLGLGVILLFRFIFINADDEVTSHKSQLLRFFLVLVVGGAIVGFFAFIR